MNCMIDIINVRYLDSEVFLAIYCGVPPIYQLLPVVIFDVLDNALIHMLCLKVFHVILLDSTIYYPFEMKQYRTST